MAFTSPLAIVTGAARGIGFHISDRLLQSAYRVLLVDNKEREGKQAENELKSKHGSEKVTFVKGDVSSPSDFKAAFDKAKSEFGRIDLLINNAGIVAESDPERTVAVNLDFGNSFQDYRIVASCFKIVPQDVRPSPLRLCERAGKLISEVRLIPVSAAEEMGAIYGSELALKYMGTSNGGKGGAVINFSSISGLIPYPDTPTYNAAKQGIIGLTRSYGHKVHFEKNEVSFMTICPYYTDTPILREAETLGVFSPKDVQLTVMSAERIAEGVMKILDDERNGSTLLILPETMKYVEIPYELRKIPTAAI